jgi:hypothetical protein
MQVIIMLVKCRMPRFGDLKMEDFQGFCEIRIRPENVSGVPSLESALRDAPAHADRWASSRAQMRIRKMLAGDDEASNKLVDALMTKVRSEVLHFQIVTIPE